ncbi:MULTISPECIES: hypothetical protein [unclassified Streptomyces]|uniref:hypothetical protein n=1 Tax=unclassified Streptomyces TaxID=2593676 RepID=UPI0037190695
MRHLMRVAVFVREGAVTSTPAAAAPASGSRKNATYSPLRGDAPPAPGGYGQAA